MTGKNKVAVVDCSGVFRKRTANGAAAPRCVASHCKCIDTRDAATLMRATCISRRIGNFISRHVITARAEDMLTAIAMPSRDNLASTAFLPVLVSLSFSFFPPESPWA